MLRQEHAILRAAVSPWLMITLLWSLLLHNRFVYGMSHGETAALR